MRSKQDFDKEVGEAKRNCGNLQLKYDLVENMMGHRDCNRVYNLLASVGGAFENLSRPLGGHPDVQVSPRFREAADERLDTIRSELEEAGKILSRYQTDSKQPKGPRLVARTAKYAMDDKGNYYAMTDGRTREIVLSTDKWKAGDVPVKISCERGIASGLRNNITLEVVFGIPNREYPVRVEHRDQDGDPFFVYEMDEDQIVMRLNSEKGKWQGTVQEDFVDFNLLPIEVQMALLGEQEWQRRSDRKRAEYSN